MMQALLATAIGLLALVADGRALRSHASAVDLFPVVSHAFRSQLHRADGVALLLEQAQFALHSAAWRLVALACFAGLMPFSP